jgi:hypothetical protein
MKNVSTNQSKFERIKMKGKWKMGEHLSLKNVRIVTVIEMWQVPLVKVIFALLHDFSRGKYNL